MGRGLGEGGIMGIKRKEEKKIEEGGGVGIDNAQSLW